ncbi:MAG: hypothetical protein NC250_08815 [Alistipes senegalensis]|nr:hypothetical protein [Bacteroides cellulosilyticus]MCM1352813.1 hypothetical protein [Alistipes senegalensis]
MIERNATVQIVASPQLTEMMLDELVGKTGVVSEDLTGPERRSNKGYMVFLKDPFQEEYEWFIPIESVRHA